MEADAVDIRDALFSNISEKSIVAGIYTDASGIISGIDRAIIKAEELGLVVNYALKEGSRLCTGDLIIQVKGTPRTIAAAEEILIGTLSKTSGIATAAQRFVATAGSCLRVVCGAWKKMPESLKEDIRRAIVTGGAHCRITDDPMIYIDKNYVDMFGSIQASLEAARGLGQYKKSIQICGRYELGDIVSETWIAIGAGADIIYVDTGKIEDAKMISRCVLPVLRKLEGECNHRHIEIAYGGGVTLRDIAVLKEYDIDIVGVGRGIVDAPLLDMHMSITKVD